ncbi:hypothetical protein AwErysi_08530 [Erysipelotrichaceae bacterium]|nr:hypothetical protein AwErysi_08530 [Erysipelotrichaceae bacterium]
MLKPSIDELLEGIQSRFALTIVVAKRARQLQLTPNEYTIEEPVGIANNEVAMALEELNAKELEYYLTRTELEHAQEKKLLAQLEMRAQLDALENENE